MGTGLATTSPWKAEEAFWVLPGPWREEVCFYVDVRKGYCYRVDDTSDFLTADDMVTHEALVRQADKKEIAAFVRTGIFLPTRLTSAAKRPCECIWVRRWKWSTDPSTQKRSIIVESRLCVRGYLDPQKWQLSRHSSTATRSSQKLLVSDCAVYEGWSMESLDVNNAFLQGFGFDMLESVCKALGIQLPDVSREVYAVVPGNVWFLLHELGQKGCPTSGFASWCLRLV